MANKSSCSKGGESLDKEEKIAAVIGELLEHHQYLHEFRIQKLVYLVELLAHLENKDWSTEANYKPFMYGVFSQDVRDVLNELKEQDRIPNEPDWQYAKSTTKFLGTRSAGTNKSDLELCDLSEEHRQWLSDIAKKLREATGSYSSEQLGDWSKGSILYNETEYDSLIDFDEEVEKHKKEIKKELRENFPELMDFIESE